MVRFLHTADWQLGMQRHFLKQEAERYRHARIEAIRRMAAIAAREHCEFAVVSGDVFESNQVDRTTVERTLEALKEMPCPVYLLPGNHDPLDAATLYRSRHFRERKPDHVHVLESNEPVPVRPGVEVVGAPWFSKRPRRDLVAEACADLDPTGAVRICVAHGVVDQLSPGRSDPALIRRDAVDRALAEGKIHYLALGDRHSATEVGPRIWYSGTPEATDFDEIEPDFVLVVELDGDRCEVEKHRAGSWRFLLLRPDLNHIEDVDAFARRLESIEGKDCTVLRVAPKGSLTLRARARFDDVLDLNAARFAAVQLWEQRANLVVVPDDLDLSELGLGGFARATVERLAALAPDDETARDALALLYRLAKGAE